MPPFLFFLKKTIIKLLLYPILIISLIISYNTKEIINSNLKSQQIKPNIFVPTAEFISYVSLGYNTVLAKLYWFETINYFGKELETDKDFSNLSKYCKLITELDNKEIYYFDFCATSLSWFAKNSNESIRLLSQGIKSNPENWKLYYLRAFNYWYFMKDYEHAKDDMLTSSKKNDAPVFVSTLAARLLTKQQGAIFAIEFLRNEIKNTNDPKIRSELLLKLKQAYLALGFEEINKAKENYFLTENKYAKSISELLDLGYLKTMPLEPYNGNYFLTEAGDVATSSQGKPLEFSGKTSDTGILKEEFQKRNND